ncbi:MAG: tetratricopeptide repeat protein [Phycisphaeraceae bacterium]
MIRKRSNILAVALAGAVMAMTPGGAWGQQRVGGDGRALDANRRVGSSGVNQAESQVDYRQRNDVVTGNVGLGRAFEGDIDYRAPGEFQGSLGSDDLFRYRAQSLGSGGVRGPLSAPELSRGYATGGGGTSIYRSYTSLPSTRPVRTPFRTRTSINVGGFSDLRAASDPGRLTQDGLIGGHLLGGVGEVGSGDVGLGMPQDTFGMVEDTEGRLLEVAASPLLGLRTFARPGQEAMDVEMLQPSLVPGDEGLERFEQPDRRDMELDEEALPADLSQQYRVFQEARLTGQPETEPESAYEAGRIPPSLLIGRELVRDGDEAQPRRLAQFEQRLFEQLEEAEDEDTGDVYLDLLRAMQEGRQIPEDRLARALEEEEEAEARREEREPLRERPGERLRPGESPEEQPEAAEEEPAREERTEPRTEEERREGRAAEDVVERLAYDLPPLETLVSQRETRTQQMMARAEQALSNEQYLTAEELYRAVLTNDPDRPLARVGLVHAQLGAGMMRSAALQLRRLFEDHPELIAARYGQDLLPTVERNQWLTEELQRMVEQDVAGFQPGLVLAYLGYQTGQRELIETGLTTAEEQAPRDSLIPLLRRIWLDSSGPDGAAPQPSDGRTSQEP